MKKVLVFMILTITLLLCLTSCHDHKFSDWSVTKNPTCTEEGVKTRYCDCGEKQSDGIPAIGHNYIDNVCINCGDVTETPECKHENLDVLSAKEPTCTETGLTEGIVCLDCKTIIKQQETVNALGHDESTYTEKDENCKLFTVIACNRIDCEYIRHIDTGKSEHTPDEAVTESNIPATCYSEGSYETVVYCAECGAELERAKHTVSKIAHTPANAVEENITDSTCYAEGKKDLVVYCSVSECHKELERKSVSIDKKAHTPAVAVEENRINPTYEADGSYDMVVYCSVKECHAELERTSHTLDMLVHHPGSAVKENIVPSTCTKEGSYDEVVYCLDDHCGHKELSRKSITTGKTAHIEASAVKENEVAPTCYAEGSYDSVVYCSVCKTELSRNKITVPKTEHTHAVSVIENRVEATCTTDGKYDEVIYCSVEKCRYEISRLSKTIPAKGHTLGAEATCATAQICTVCKITITPALGHDWKEATCTEPKTCQRASCGATDGEAKEHDFSEWVTVKEATTTEEGLKERTCECGKKETETIPVVKAYVRDGNYIYFGEYPQTIKADDITITSTTDDRGYYLGSDGSYYALVIANPHNSSYTFSTGARVTEGNVYYFKVEPIRWRILSEENGVAFILCDSIIANVPYQSDYTFDSSTGYNTTANGAPSGTYANNYKYSEVRAWLNSIFYETAFSEFQRSLILTTLVDNSLASTTNSSNPYVCENTNDKVFLLSWAEAINSAYGFSSDGSEYDTARRMLTSDYSRATGVYMNTISKYYGKGWWWLRSPTHHSSSEARYTDVTGGIYSRYIYDDYHGIVPALRIQLDEEKSYTRDGDYIYFGEYPQTIKADDVTITDTTDDRGYYLGSDGCYYAKVTASPFGSDYTFSTGATVTSGTVYYFKVEPIRWRILSEENGEALILCDSIIEKHRFGSSNNYAESEIRAWLNATFYETAFSTLQNAIILTTEVDNSVTSTGYTSNPYVCENTNDKVFLLSYAEATNSAYGFYSDRLEFDIDRMMLTSDYSRAIGTFMNTSSYYGNGWWWLRSSVIADSDYARHVYHEGYLGSNIVAYTCGVVPALRIVL